MTAPAVWTHRPTPPPVVAGISTNTTSGQLVAVTLPASDANGNTLTFRVVSQPAHGSVGVSNRVATYFPDPGFVGGDFFTFTAHDGFSDGNLATGTVTVAQGPFAIVAAALVPSSVPLDWPAPFGVTATRAMSPPRRASIGILAMALRTAPVRLPTTPTQSRGPISGRSDARFKPARLRRAPPIPEPSSSPRRKPWKLRSLPAL
jgi:hypothetical protein